MVMLCLLELILTIAEGKNFIKKAGWRLLGRIRN